MAEKKSDPSDDDESGETYPSVDVPRRGEVTVEIRETPPPSPHKKIHRRRPAPPVPDRTPEPKGD